MPRYRSLREARRELYDREQAERRTREQNDKIIELIQTHDIDGAWAYSEVPPIGGDVTLQWIPHKQWLIERDGTVTEQPYASGATFKRST